ncbi:MFS transporter [Longispora sp. NPDC051575]|uniref:MFS transporter n=1 Tax=Longispora sp. NPDC051575 TaxID=3154943 RepID=UPI003439F8E1
MTERATFGQVLAEPTFRIIFGTRTLAIAANTVRMVALSVLVYGLTGSPLLGAVTFGIGFLPQLLGGVLLGAFADRLRPRRLITAGYLLEAASAVLLGLGGLPVWAMLVVVALVACLSPVFGGASAKLVAVSLTGDAYVLGRSLMGMASSGAQLLGLAGAGAAVAFLGAREALLVSAGCMLVAAVVVRWRLTDFATAEPTVEPIAEPCTRQDRDLDGASGAEVDAVPGGTPGGRAGAGGGRRRSAVAESLAGSRDLLTDRRIRGLFLAQWLPPGLVVGGESLLVPYSDGRGFPAGSAGLLLACLPVGMLVGDVVVARCVRPARRERLYGPLVALLGVPLMGLVLDLPLVATGVLLALSGAGFAFGLTLQRQFLEAVPEPMRGQAFALLSTGLMTVQGVGPVLVGGLAEVGGIGVAIGAAGVATAVCAVVLHRTVRDVPAAPRPGRVPEPAGRS